jgi:putative transposase
MKRLYAQSRALQSKAARQRHDFYHQLTAKLVARFAYLGSEELAVKNMVKRPKAKRDESGQAIPNGACRKAGLNRSIYDAAPSMLLSMLKTKAEEAGSDFVLANTRILKPTQRCHACGAIVSKTLADRTHHCACGIVCDRDENAARTILRWMTEGNSWFASGTGAAGPQGLSETPAIAQRAWRE